MADRVPKSKNESEEGLNTSITQRKQEVDAALMETVLVSLRGSLKELEEDNWMYEAPRHTCH
ncbi:hypothetical protein ABBQ38_004259 [Trebouxia sp. C0009 RCD-2024]